MRIEERLKQKLIIELAKQKEELESHVEQVIDTLRGDIKDA